MRERHGRNGSARNPAIFTPDWLERNQLLGSEDADSARKGEFSKELVISHQLSSFETKWFSLQVIDRQFSITSKEPLTLAFRDLASGIFQLVPHTPIKALGLNFFGHYKLANVDDYHRVGDVLAPKEIWNNLFPDRWAGLSELSIKMMAGKRDEPPKSKDEIRVMVQSSNKVKFGVFLMYNEHNDLAAKDGDELRPGDRAASIIDKQWEASWRNALRVFDGILARALGG